MNIFEFIGAAGLVFITIGVITRKRGYQDKLYIVGGVLLEIYSIHIKDLIFMVLQVIFTLTAAYDFVNSTRQIKVIEK